MTTLDTAKYGYPLASGYVINTDLALHRVEYESGWRRQRRTYLHNASLITLSWNLTTKNIKGLNDWLQAQPVGDFFYCDLLTGNDSESTGCQIEPVLIRRTSVVTTKRIPYTDRFEMSFQAETKFQDNYQPHATGVANSPPLDYPSNFPTPLASDFGSQQGTRNISTYTLSYSMNTVMLRQWLKFAGFAGTAWFRTLMVSATMPCGVELIRFISAPAQTLDGPDRWTVTVEAEAMPGYTSTYYVLPPTAECTYDSDIEYDNEFEDYDCGGVPPSQGVFTMIGTAQTTEIYATDVKDGEPAKSTILVKFLNTGEIVADPLFTTPAWLTWHSNPYYLTRPAISCDQVIEFSIDDGVTWQYSSPVPGGVWFSLKNQDVWFRLENESNISSKKYIFGNFYFEENKLPTATATQYASGDYSGIKTGFYWQAENIVTNPVFGPIFGAVFNYSVNTTRATLPTNTIAIEMVFRPSGYVTYTYSNGLSAKWHEKPANGVGNGLWIIFTTISATGVSFPKTGELIPMSTDIYLKVTSAIAQPADTVLLAEWIGTYEIYNAQAGGTLVGDGSVTLHYQITETS